MKIGDRVIAKGALPYVVAELSGNHNGKIDYALALVALAKKAGAEAVKFQVYTADTITLNCNKPDFIIQDGLWKGRTLYQLYEKAHTPWGWLPKLFEQAAKEKITAFASVFDPTSVDLMEKLGCPAYKIASFEITDTPLIAYAAKTGKPMIISTGMATQQEILDANEASGGRAAFLHCTSDYPGNVEFADLDRMRRIEEILDFKNPVGISDHTSETELVPIAATALHAAIIEKHLKLPGDRDSEDAEFSLGPIEFSRMVTRVHQAHEAMKLRSIKGNPSFQLRRSLYAVDDIKQGEALTEKNIRSIRPGYGAAPKHQQELLGQKAKRDYRKGDRLP